MGRVVRQSFTGVSWERATGDWPCHVRVSLKSGGERPARNWRPGGSPTPLRFATVARLASRWLVATLCQATGVSRSEYYARNDRIRHLAAANPRRVASDALCVVIQDCHPRTGARAVASASMSTSSRTSSAPPRAVCTSPSQCNASAR